MITTEKKVGIIILEVQRIERSKGDEEIAHTMQDELTEALLRQIAMDPEGAQELCREAIKVYDIDFPRYCA